MIPNRTTPIVGDKNAFFAVQTWDGVIIQLFRFNLLYYDELKYYPRSNVWCRQRWHQWNSFRCRRAWKFHCNPSGPERRTLNDTISPTCKKSKKKAFDLGSNFLDLLPVVFRKIFQLVPPRVPKFREPVQKYHERLGIIAFLNIMHVNSSGQSLVLAGSVTSILKFHKKFTFWVEWLHKKFR